MNKNIQYRFFLISQLAISFPQGDGFPNCFSQQQSATNSDFYNVKFNGAVENGTTIDSKAINKTIETASNAGGGTVYFPAGNYLTSSIRLKRNISSQFLKKCGIYPAYCKLFKKVYMENANSLETE